MEQIAANSPVSGHFLGKLKRRRAILDAAREIITAEGEGGLNMRAMAARAGVSPATPYNLFGSKQAVLQAVYDEDQETFYREFDERTSREPLTRLFDLIDLSIAHWQATPAFHKALLAILYRGTGGQIDDVAGRPRLTLVRVRQLIADVVAAGILRADTPIDIVTATLARVFRAVGQEWIDGTLALPRARTELREALALLLAGLVKPGSQDALAAIARRYESDAREAERSA